MNSYKVFAQRIGLIGVTNILLSLSSIILLPILTKNFTIQEYGIWVQVMTTIGLIPNLAGLGFPYAIIRFLASVKKQDEIQDIFYSMASIVLLSSIIISLILILLSKILATSLFDNNLPIATILPLILFLATLNNLFFGFFRAFQQIKKYSAFLLMQTYLNVVIVAYAALSGYSIYSAVMGLLIVQLVLFIIMSIIIFLEIGFKIPKFRNIREYLSFGLPTIPSNLSYWIVDSSDRYIIGIILGTAFVGYYSPGYSLGSMVLMFLAPFTTVLPAVLSNHYDNGEIKIVKTMLNYSIKYFLLMAIPSAVGLSILSKPILLILSTPEIAAEGYIITPLVALGAILVGVSGIIAHSLILEKKTEIIGTIWIIAAILNVILNIIFVPYIGIIGAAAVTLIAYLFTFISINFYSSKYVKLDFNPVFILKSTLASILMSIFIITMNPKGILSVLIVIIISTIIYLTTLFILKAIIKEEIGFIKTLFHKTS